MTQLLSMSYSPPGPVTSAFLAATGDFQSLMGPIGGGKTSANFIKHLYNARNQKPHHRTGTRKYRVCIIRDTYRNLWATTLKSWWYWLPQDIGEWNGGENNPASHRIKWALKDGTKVDFEALFRAIGDQSIEEALQGLEVTAFFLNEADKLSRDVFTYCRGRTGRFPKMEEGGPSWHGITADYNAPDTDNWLYTLREERCPREFNMLRQPSGLSAGAENTENLPPGYYQKQMIDQPAWYIRRMIKNEYGFSRDGQPVYDDYSDHLHCSDSELFPVEGLPLILGGDAGRKPACIIGQEMPNGQWRILDEIVGIGMGAQKFGARVNKALAKPKYRAWQNENIYENKSITAWGDPSAYYASDTSELSWLQLMKNATKIPWRPAPGNNDLTIRLGAVEGALRRVIDGSPGFLMSPTCKVLRKGFNSHYRYRRRRVGGSEHFDDVPEKNDWSHAHDGLQYLLLGAGEGAELLNRRSAQLNDGPRQIAAITDDDPYGDFEDGRSHGMNSLRRHVLELRDRAFNRLSRAPQHSMAVEE
jgi:hypothetical protein